MTKKKTYTAPLAQSVLFAPQAVLAESFDTKDTTDNVDESDKSNEREWTSPIWGEE